MTEQFYNAIIDACMLLDGRVHWKWLDRLYLWAWEKAQGFHICPVCDYSKLEEEPNDSFEICPQCGVEFGYDDAGTSHAVLRERWIAAGRPFWEREAENSPAWVQWYGDQLHPDEYWTAADFEQVEIKAADEEPTAFYDASVQQWYLTHTPLAFDDSFVRSRSLPPVGEEEG